MTLKFRSFIIITFLIWNGLAFAANVRQYKFDPLGNLIVAGDIHADPLALLNLFLSNGLIDAEGNWIATNTDVVLVGDIIDRGPDSLTTLDLIIHYKRDAAKHGCRLQVLRGNHDLLFFENNFDYISEEDRAKFAERGATTDLAIAQLLADPTWPYASELLERQMFIKYGDIGIIHADLGAWGHQFNPDQVNVGFRHYTEQNIEQVLAGKLGGVPAGGLFEFGAGPHNSRDMVESKLSQSEFDVLLAKWGIKTLIVGHTITESKRPETRYGGKLIMVDTGISSGLGGQVWSIRARGKQIADRVFEPTRFARRNAEASKILTAFKKERKKLRAIHNLKACGS